MSASAKAVFEADSGKLDAAMLKIQGSMLRLQKGVAAQTGSVKEIRQFHKCFSICRGMRAATQSPELLRNIGRTFHQQLFGDPSLTRTCPSGKHPRDGQFPRIGSWKGL